MAVDNNFRIFRVNFLRRQNVQARHSVGQERGRSNCPAAEKWGRAKGAHFWRTHQVGFWNLAPSNQVLELLASTARVLQRRSPSERMLRRLKTPEIMRITMIWYVMINWPSCFKKGKIKILEIFNKSSITSASSIRYSSDLFAKLQLHLDARLTERMGLEQSRLSQNPTTNPWERYWQAFGHFFRSSFRRYLDKCFI